MVQGEILDELFSRSGIGFNRRAIGTSMVVEDAEQKSTILFKHVVGLLACYYGAHRIDDYDYHVFAYEEKEVLSFLVFKVKSEGTYRTVMPAFALFLAKWVRSNSNTVQDYFNYGKEVVCQFGNPIGFYLMVALEMYAKLSGNVIENKYMARFIDSPVIIRRPSTATEVGTKTVTFGDLTMVYIENPDGTITVWRT